MRAVSVFKSAEGKNAILGVYDSLLEKWPIPYEKYVLKTGQGDTFAVVCGEKTLPALFLLHGSSSNSAMWIADISEYAAHFRVYAVDIPGEPGKSADVRPDLKTSAYSDWLNDVLDGLCIDKASFAGISLGGWVCLKFAAAHPDRVSKLALLCPAGIGPQKASVMLYAMLMKPLGKKGEDKLIRKVMGSAEITDETVEYSRLISKNFSPYLGEVPIIEDDELGRIICPVLLIAGQKDVLINTEKTVKRANKTLPQAVVVTLPNAGHGLIDQRERILPFLMGIDK